MKQLKIHGLKILSHFSSGLFLLHYSWRDMFNSELVIADISSINCALYSFTQFQFILANRSMGEKKSRKDKRAKTTSWCHQTKPYRSIACKVCLQLRKKLMQWSTVLGILITLHSYQMAELNYSDLKQFERPHDSVWLLCCCFYPQRQKVPNRWKAEVGET